jgi:hypothetical protein
MPMLDDARSALASLMSEFEANALKYPGFDHILIEMPHAAPGVVDPPPAEAGSGEQAAYDAFTKGQLDASGMRSGVPTERELIEFARRNGLPARKAAGIVRRQIEAGITASKASLLSPFGKAYDEVQKAIFSVSAKGRKPVVRHFDRPGHPAQIFLDAGRGEGAYEALVRLARPAVERLAGLRLLELTERRPDPSELSWSELMENFYVRQWMLFVHRHAKDHPDDQLSSAELSRLEGFRLRHGGKARRLLPGAFEASALVLRRIIDAIPEQRPDPKPRVGTVVSPANAEQVSAQEETRQEQRADHEGSRQVIESIPPPMTGSYLGLTLDQGRRQVRREGFDEAIEFGGKRIAWKLLVRLQGARDAYSSVDDLGSAWQDVGRDKPGTERLYPEISKLEKMLRPLGLEIQNAPDTGWRLVERKQDGSKTGRRGSARRK